MSEAVKVMGMGVPAQGGGGGAASTAQAVQQRGQRLLSRTRHTDHVHWTHLFPASLPRSEGRETEPGRRTRVGGCLSQYMRHHRCGFGAFRSRAEGSGVCSSLRCEPLSAEVFVRLWRGKTGGSGPEGWLVPVCLSRPWVCSQEPTSPLWAVGQGPSPSLWHWRGADGGRVQVCACVHMCVCLPGALCVLAVLSPGHAQAWIGQELSPASSNFSTPAPACRVLGRAMGAAGGQSSPVEMGSGARCRVPQSVFSPG